MVGPAAKREGVAHLQAVMGLSERRACSMQIPTKPAMHSNLKPATYSDAKPASVPI